MDTLAALAFLGMVFLISASGALAPGPVLAAAISKGYDDPRAGVKMAAGHSLLEVPLMAAIFLGAGAFLKDDLVVLAIGLVGGAFLLWMGGDLVRTTEVDLTSGWGRGTTSFAIGALTTAANPYFFVWWATVGATLISEAVGFGIVMLPLFALAHLSVDYGWLQFVSFSVFRSKGLWGRRGHRVLFIISGAIMVVFGAYFILSSLANVL